MKTTPIAFIALAVLGGLLSAHAEDKPIIGDNTFGQLRIVPQGFLPPAKPVMDIPMRDPHATLGPDGFYYLVGSQPPDGSSDFWGSFNGIRIVRSPDLKQWDDLGYVFKLKENGTWQLTYNATPLLPKFIKDREHPKPVIWAPDMYYVKGTWWIAYHIAYNGWTTCNGMLKSTSGKVTGPYVEVNADGPITEKNEDDPGLFLADDGQVYYVWVDDRFALMNDTLNKLAEPVHTVKPSNTDKVAGEGGAIREINGRIYAVGAGSQAFHHNYHGTETYDTYVACSDNIYGPYGPDYIAIRFGGHNVIFRGKNDQWYSTIFSWGSMTPVNQKPGILPIELDEYAHICPYYDQFQIVVPDARVQESPWSYTITKPTDDWARLSFDDHGWQSGGGAFGGNLGPKTHVPVRTPWTSPEIWLRKNFTLPNSAGSSPQIALDVVHSGPTQIYINGVLAYTSTHDHTGYYDKNGVLAFKSTNEDHLDY